MKKGVSLILAFVFVLGLCFSAPVSIKANAASTDVLVFELSNDGASYVVSDCDGEASGEITVPAEYNGLPVSEIGANAFFYCRYVTEITLPETVTSIGSYAFAHCELLQAVNGIERVTTLGEAAFYECASLSEAVIPTAIDILPKMVFAYCDKLTNVSIPANIKNIDQSAFSYCLEIENITIPDSVTEIGAAAFYACASLKTITLPDTITVLNDDVFGCCTSLENIVFSKDVTYIGQSAFCYCEALKSFVIPESVVKIEPYTFEYCSILENVTIPESVKSIGQYAFDECDSLKKVIYEGSRSSWSGVSISEGNDKLTGCDFVYLKEDEIASPASSAKNTKNGVLVSWQSVPGATGYDIYRSQEVKGVFGEWEKLTSVNGSVTSYVDKTATSGQVYKFAVTSQKGNYSTEISKTSLILYLAEPKIKNTELRKNGIAFSWNDVAGANGYVIFKKKGSELQRYAEVSSTTTTFVDTDVKSGNSYTYAVAAMDKNGTLSTYSAFNASFVVPATPVVKIANSPEGIKVSWNKISNAKSYTVYRRAYNAKTKKWSGWTEIKKGCKAVSFVDTTVKLGVNYRYTVRALNGQVVSSVKSTGTLKYNVAPVVKVANTSNSIRVSWSAVANSTGYVVYSSTYNGKTKKWSSWKNRGTAAANKTAWADKNVKNGTYYKYTVKALNGSFKSTNKSSQALLSLAQPTVKAVRVSNGIKVTWNKVSGAKSYVVYRSEYTNGKWGGWKSISTPGNKVITVTDKKITSGKTYRYTVKAVNGKSASSYKATSGILFLAQPTVKIANSATGVKVTWNKISGAKGYVVYSSSYNASTKKWSSWKNRGTAAGNKTAWVDKSVKSGSYYKYTVKAVNGNYSSTYKSSAGLLYLAQPTVKVSVAENGIKVNWSKSGGAKKYVVYRSVYDNGKYTGWKEMGSFSSSQTTWTDVNISAADIYKYTVRAVNNNAKSSFDSGKIIKGDGGEVSFEPATWKKSTVFNFYKNASAGITDNDKAGYTLKQWQKLQNLEFEGLDDVMRESIESMLVSEKDAESIVVEKGSTEASQYYPKCILTDLSKIKSTSAERLSNGNYKIKIVMQDEDTPLNASSSFLGKITTNVVYWSDIEKALKETGVSIDVKDKSLNHKNFTITAEMTPDGKFVSVRHYGEIDFDMTFAIMLSTYEMDMEIVSVIDYTDFKY